MKIIFMRHGEAEANHIDDEQRQLTATGRQQVQDNASAILEKYTPDLFIVSPYIRAKQTLQPFINSQEATPVAVSGEIVPNSSAEVAINEIGKVIKQFSELNQLAGNEDIDCALVVCHMPIVAKMVALLTGQQALSYQLAEARVVEFADFKHVAEYLGKQIDTITV